MKDILKFIDPIQFIECYEDCIRNKPLMVFKKVGEKITVKRVRETDGKDILLVAHVDDIIDVLEKTTDHIYIEEYESFGSENGWYATQYNGQEFYTDKKDLLFETPKDIPLHRLL